MKKTTGYTIDFATATITITKKFGKAANQFDTPEFKIMQRLREEFAGFKFEYKSIEKKENKKSYRGLTIEEMKRFISTRAEEEQMTFKKVIAIAETKQSKYAIVKKWFLDHYKDAYNEEIKSIKVEQEVASIEAELEVISANEAA